MIANRKYHEALPGLVMIIVGLVFFLSSFSIEVLDDGGVAPRVFPMAASLLIAGLGALQLAFARSDNAPSPDGPKEVTSNALPITGLIVLSIFYALSINYVGYLVATAIAGPAALYLFGIRSTVGLVVAFFLCPAIFHLVFFYGLGVFPPYGLWFDLLDVIQS